MNKLQQKQLADKLRNEWHVNSGGNDIVQWLVEQVFKNISEQKPTGWLFTNPLNGVQGLTGSKYCADLYKNVKPVFLIGDES